jgi:2-amino-4-hydroxy-6-hydroxymethyldihydropteridine diphosphokinase/dihydroneopterin aldolase
MEEKFCDKIQIRDLRCGVFCGIDDDEVERAQEILTNITLFLRIPSRKDRENICHTISYTDVASYVKNALSIRHFPLVEGMAHYLCLGILETFPPTRRVTVTVEKRPRKWKNCCGGFSCECTVCRSTCALALGSNVGDRFAHLQTATECIGSLHHTKILAVSSIQETNPILFLNQEKFLNQCLLLETFLTPLDMLDSIAIIEQDLGRERFLLNGPRTIDIDILLFGDMHMAHHRLQIPHPHLRKRQFWIDGLRECGVKIWPE